MHTFNFGENLRIIRQEKGISQEAMAQHLNISQATYATIENQTTVTNHKWFYQIAEILDVPGNKLIAPLKEPDLQDEQSTYTPELESNPIEILNTPFGNFILIGLSLTIIKAIYDAVRGACSAIETSDSTMTLASWTAALLTAAFIYYWIRKTKKSSS